MTREVIRIRNEFYIRSSSPRVDVRTRVLKQGDTFAVFDRFGDIETFGSGELGLYYQDTRFLSRLTLKLGKDRLNRLKAVFAELGAAGIEEDDDRLALVSQRAIVHDLHRRQ